MYWDRGHVQQFVSIISANIEISHCKTTEEMVTDTRSISYVEKDIIDMPKDTNKSEMLLFVAVTGRP